MAAAYPSHGTVVDVGGGSGSLLIQILPNHQQARGLLFEWPHVAEAALARLSDAGVVDRCSVQAGHVFEAVAPGGDVYLLSHIIHDWGEQSCLRIPRNCRQAVHPESRLLLIEMVVPGPNEPHPAKERDLVRLMVAGGRERTAADDRHLLARAGLQRTRVVPTSSPV
ncbi:MAG: methyltransferase [Cyanobacteriota bacterium]|nr:methyltransferase [Cyanobacteriota bacterium]